MKNQIKKIFHSFFFCIVLISGFFHYTQIESYSPETPPHIGSILEPYSDQGVHVRAKAYTAQESKRYLKRNLLSTGMRPVQLTIQNNTADSLFLSNASVDLETFSASSVTNRLHSHYLHRSIGLKIASIFFWPLMIPSFFDSIITFHHHRAMKRDYTAKSLKEKGEVVIPYSTTHRLVFVRASQLQDEMHLCLQVVNTGRHYPISAKIELS